MKDAKHGMSEEEDMGYLLILVDNNVWPLVLHINWEVPEMKQDQIKTSSNNFLEVFTPSLKKNLKFHDSPPPHSHTLSLNGIIMQ